MDLEVFIPFVLLAIGFLLKLFIGRSWDTATALQSMCELPVDIVLLALSFVVAFTISKVNDQSLGLSYCLLGILVTIIIVSLWRFSLNLFMKKNQFWILLFSLNFFVASYSIRESIKLIYGTQTIINSSDKSTQITTELK